MILTDREIRLEIDEGNIRFEPDIDHELQIGDASVDVRLGTTLRIPTKDNNIIIRPTAPNRPDLYGEQKEIDSSGYNLLSCKLVLGATYEKLMLPNYLLGRLEGKSSLARFGLMVHATSAHIDPGFSGVLVLELYNLGPNTIVLEPLMLIAHVLFQKVSMPPSKSYSGQFAEQLRP
jgi:dCTP deaminase